MGIKGSEYLNADFNYSDPLIRAAVGGAEARSAEASARLAG